MKIFFKKNKVIWHKLFVLKPSIGLAISIWSGFTQEQTFLNTPAGQVIV